MSSQQTHIQRKSLVRQLLDVQTREDTYKKLVPHLSYPCPITYRPDPCNRYGASALSVNELICHNLQVIIPNVDYNLHANTSIDVIENNIQQTKEYMNTIQKTFIDKCIHEEKRLQYFKARQPYADAFDISQLSQLNPDIVNHILSFVEPESRINIYLAQHPKMYEDMNNWKRSAIEKLYLQYIYEPITVNDILYKHFGYQHNKIVPTIRNMHIVKNKANKHEYINIIRSIIQCFTGCTQYTLEIKQYFHLYAMKIIQSIVYTNQRRDAKQKPKTKPKTKPKKTKPKTNKA